MNESFTLDDFDSDGAVADTAAAVEGDSRASFLRKAGLGAGALVAGGAFAGAMPALARGQAIPQSDIGILNFALVLEELEAAFYAEAVAKKRIGGAKTMRLAQVIANHEATHVRFLRQVLGAKAVAKPRFDFKGTTESRATFLATADVLENTGVQAYLGQVPNIKNKTVLLGAGRILPVEARHAAWVRAERFPSYGPGSPQTPAPAGFEDGFSKARILRIVNSTGFIVG